MKKSLLTLAASAVCAAGLLAGSSAHTPAAAQFFSSFGYSSASGKQVVSFPKNYSVGTIIVSFGDRRLYHVRQQGRAVSYPIAVPRSNMMWSGTMSVSQKRVNPGWTPTPRMRRENPSLPAHVPGGHPRNPLGSRALYLGSSLYRIHGTDAPQLIGREVSSGCIRMHDAHVQELYNQTRIGTRVVVTMKRFQTAAVSSAPSSGTFGAARPSGDWDPFNRF